MRVRPLPQPPRDRQRQAFGHWRHWSLLREDARGRNAASRETCPTAAVPRGAALFPFAARRARPEHEYAYRDRYHRSAAHRRSQCRRRGLMATQLPALAKAPTGFVKAALAGLVFSVLMQMWHQPVGPSELHLIGATTVLPSLRLSGDAGRFWCRPDGATPVFEPQDLQHLGVNALTLGLPLIVLHIPFGKRLFDAAAGERFTLARCCASTPPIMPALPPWSASGCSSRTIPPRVTDWALWALAYLPVFMIEALITYGTVTLLRGRRDGLFVSRFHGSRLAPLRLRSLRPILNRDRLNQRSRLLFWHSAALIKVHDDHAAAPERGDRIARANAILLAVASGLAGANATVVFATAGLVGQNLTHDLEWRPFRLLLRVRTMQCDLTLPTAFRSAALRATFVFLAGNLVGAASGFLAAICRCHRVLCLFCRRDGPCGRLPAVVQSYRYAAADTATPAFSAPRPSPGC